MRHRRHAKHFGRKPSARKALVRGLVDALVEHNRIQTTVEKAKELRRHVEKAITAGKKGTVHARRVLLSRYPNKNTVQTIMSDLSVRFKERPGGYTRIIKSGRRPGDSAEMALIEFVDYDYEKVERPDEKTVALEQKAIAKRAEKRRKRLRKLQQESRRLAR